MRRSHFLTDMGFMWALEATGCPASKWDRMAESIGESETSDSTEKGRMGLSTNIPTEV